MLRKELRISSEPSQARRVADWIGETAAAYGIERELAFRVTLCVDESIGNIIRHAYASSEQEDIYISIDIDPELLEVDIRDDGAPFNPLEAPLAELPQSVEEAKIGGLGIYLIRHYCDSCTYTRVGQQNCLTLSFNRAPAQ